MLPRVLRPSFSKSRKYPSLIDPYTLYVSKSFMINDIVNNPNPIHTRFAIDEFIHHLSNLPSVSEREYTRMQFQLEIGCTEAEEASFPYVIPELISTDDLLSDQSEEEGVADSSTEFYGERQRRFIENVEMLMLFLIVDPRFRTFNADAPRPPISEVDKYKGFLRRCYMAFRIPVDTYRDWFIPLTEPLPEPRRRTIVQA